MRGFVASALCNGCALMCLEKREITLIFQRYVTVDAKEKIKIKRTNNSFS